MGYEYRYMASAVAAGGVFRRPNPLAAVSPANLALPPAGGAAQIEQTDYALGDLIRIGYSFCAVSGTSAREGEWDTLATTVLEKVSIQGVITADRVVSRIAVHATLDAGGKGTCRVSLAGTHFQNLRVGGVEISENLLGDLEGLSDWDRFMAKCEYAPLGARKAGNNAFRIAAYRPGLPKWAPWTQGTDDQEIYIPNFGRVRFGEYHVTDRDRFLSMISLRLGSPDEGDGDSGGSGAAGHTPP